MSDHKINHNNLVHGVHSSLLANLISNNVTDTSFITFCKSYILYNKIKKDRVYPRISKTPFSKWYVKYYSEMAAIAKIINAIKTDKLTVLNKNLKSKANKILAINGVNCAAYKT